MLGKLAAFKERSLAFQNRLATALGVSMFCVGYGDLRGGGVDDVCDAQTCWTGSSDSGRPLPLVTRIVKAASDLLVTRWWAI